MREPPLFRWIDALTFGGPAALATVVAVLAATSERNADVPLGAWLTLGFVVLAFWAGYAIVLVWRHRHLSRIRYVTKHGVVVIAAGGVVPPLADLEGEIDRTLELWYAVPGASARAVADAIRDTALWVKPFPFQLHGEGPKFAGFARPFAKQVAVGMDGRLLPGTALGHELGHILAYEIVEDGSEDKLRALSKSHGVPY